MCTVRLSSFSSILGFGGFLPVPCHVVEKRCQSPKRRRKGQVVCVDLRFGLILFQSTGNVSGKEVSTHDICRCTRIGDSLDVNSLASAEYETSTLPVSPNAMDPMLDDFSVLKSSGLRVRSAISPTLWTVG